MRGRKGCSDCDARDVGHLVLCAHHQEVEGSVQHALCASLFLWSRTSAHGVVLPILWVSLGPSVKPLWKDFHRHAQRCVVSPG